MKRAARAPPGSRRGRAAPAGAGRPLRGGAAVVEGARGGGWAGGGWAEGGRSSPGAGAWRRPPRGCIRRVATIGAPDSWGRPGRREGGGSRAGLLEQVTGDADSQPASCGTLGFCGWMDGCHQQPGYSCLRPPTCWV